VIIIGWVSSGIFFAGSFVEILLEFAYVGVVFIVATTFGIMTGISQVFRGGN
jgi:hypothetical protein